MKIPAAQFFRTGRLFALGVLTLLVAPTITTAQTRAVRGDGSLDGSVRGIQARLPARLEEPTNGTNPRAIAFARGRTFVAYPGSPGIQTDVFTQNFETLHRDFGVPLARLIYRDSSGYQARYTADGRGGAAGVARPPGTAIARDSEVLGANRFCGQAPRSVAGVAAQEAAFLKSVRDEFGLPVVVLCHSAFCRTALEGVLATNYGRAGTPIVDAFFFVQGDAPRSIAEVIRPINDGLTRAGRFGDSGCALEGAIRPEPGALERARAFFVADGGTTRNNFAPIGYGRYLGPLQVAHIDAVVSSPRSNRPPAFRRALMHALLGVATE